MGKSKGRIKGVFITTKTAWQILIVLFEILLIASIFVYLSQFLKPIQDGYDTLERYLLFIPVYEIIVYIVLSFINDARRDALLALRTAFEQALFYCETGSDFVKKNLVEGISNQLDSGVLNHTDIRKEYENLLQYLENKDALSIRYKLVVINHSYEMCDLQWKLTFILRFFK
jgi:hypothetical protein